MPGPPPDTTRVLTVDGLDLLVHFDGLCEPRNPGGHGCYGFVVAELVVGTVLHEGMGCLGTRAKGQAMTNNVAEYAALVYALLWVQEHGRPGSLECRGDSQLVVNQVNGAWAINHEHLRSAATRARELLAAIGCPWELRWVPREENEAADALSQRAYEQATGRVVVPRPRGKGRGDRAG